MWSILVLELIFEVLIRPKDYSELVNSEKAFAPSAARHINRFHLFFETLSLITFFPEFSCVTDAQSCQRDSSFSRVQASIDAVLGDSHATSARGRFILGITALRFFGVVRHWKQMWIMNTFKPTGKVNHDSWLSRHDSSPKEVRPGPDHPKKSEVSEWVDHNSSVEFRGVPLTNLTALFTSNVIFNISMKVPIVQVSTERKIWSAKSLHPRKTKG